MEWVWSLPKTSVPSMFQGLLNIEGIWVQHRVPSEPFNLLLWNFHRMLLLYKTFIWTNNNKNSQVTVGGHFGSHIENMKNAYKQLFNARKIKHPSTPSIKHNDLFYFKMFRGHNYIIYESLCSYLYKNWLYKNICNVIRFRGRQKQRNMSKGMTYRTH